MDEREDRRGRVVLLRIAAAVTALAAVTGLVADLAGKASREPRPPSAPNASPAPTGGVDEPRRGPIVAAGERTVYDAQDDLSRCARSGSSAGAAPGDDIERISARLERIRGLDFTVPVDTRLVPREEVGERFARGYLRELSQEEADTQERVAVELGLIAEGTDLREAGRRLVAQGVAGFYNPRKKRLFAAAGAGGLAPFDEVVLAHELDHALVDQVLGLPAAAARDPILGDVMLAHQALAEGDATLAMSKYATVALGPEATAGFLARFSGAPVTPPAGIPYALLRTTEFPYYEGLLLACAAWRRGGWDAIDAMYLRPPGSTAEIVFPARYRRDVEPELPPAPGSPKGWEPLLTASMGAFDVMLLLENADLVSAGATVPGGHAGEVRGWDGGALRAWRRGDETAIHIALVDAGVDLEPGRERHLCDVMRGWLEESFPGLSPASSGRREVRTWTTERGMAGMRCRRSSVQLALGPSETLVRRLLPYVRSHPPSG